MSGPVTWPIEIYRGDDCLLQFQTMRITYQFDFS